MRSIVNWGQMNNNIDGPITPTIKKLIECIWRLWIKQQQWSNFQSSWFFLNLHALSVLISSTKWFYEEVILIRRFVVLERLRSKHFQTVRNNACSNVSACLLPRTASSVLCLDYGELFATFSVQFVPQCRMDRVFIRTLDDIFSHSMNLLTNKIVL